MARLKVPGHALHGAAVKQVLGVLQAAGYGVLILSQVQREVHLRRAAADLPTQTNMVSVGLLTTCRQAGSQRQPAGRHLRKQAQAASLTRCS